MFGEIRENAKRVQKTKGGQLSTLKGQRILKLHKRSLTFTTGNSGERMVKHVGCDTEKRKQPPPGASQAPLTSSEV